MKLLYALLLTGLFAISLSASTVVYPGEKPGVASIKQEGTSYFLENNVVRAVFSCENELLRLDSFSALGELSSKPSVRGEELFVLNLDDGTSIRSSELKLFSVPEIKNLKGNPKALKYSERLDGVILVAKYRVPNKSIGILWTAILRDGSHYLRQEISFQSNEDVKLRGIVGLNVSLAGELKVIGNTRGSPLVGECYFMGLETPMGINSVGDSSGMSVKFSPTSWKPESWGEAKNAPDDKKKNNSLRETFGDVEISSDGELEVVFNYKSGNNRLNLRGIQLMKDGQVVGSDWHNGFSGNAKSNNVYRVRVPSSGVYRLSYFVDNKEEPLTSSGNIRLSLAVKNVEKDSDGKSIATGFWSRKTVLPAKERWKLSSVIGILAPKQNRRSFLAYSERERVMPWRPFIHYNSWYELNINRNNFPDPKRRMSEAQCLEVVSAWKEKFYDKRNVSIDAFVWDDGWDEFNSLWDFHVGFPDGFKKIDELAREQKAGTGAWLGPVGGYGGAKGSRLANWNRNHPNNKIGNFQLSNKEYFDAFVGRCGQMVKDYDMRYFKFDGISTHFHAKGPGNEEDAEGIIRVVNALRKLRGDLFINCTVGTWASPFWFQIVDSVWRQENDHGGIGEGNNREKWITYRDRLVYEVFVVGSPLCPINSLMTHGLMVTKFGPPNSMPKELEGIKKEMRCAFACGSALQELYVDRDLMNTIGGNEVLWDELAKSIKWFRSNADVLPDVHWVGGNPWDNSKKAGEVYGWASWNNEKVTLGLRNPTSKKQEFRSTYRKIFDIPTNAATRIILTDAYKDQVHPAEHKKLLEKVIDIDSEVVFVLNPFEVFVFDGTVVK